MTVGPSAKQPKRRPTAERLPLSAPPQFLGKRVPSSQDYSGNTIRWRRTTLELRQMNEDGLDVREANHRGMNRVVTISPPPQFLR
jgi:hypothetical protein